MNPISVFLGGRRRANRALVTAFAVLLLAISTLWAAPAEARYAAMVVDAESGQILHEANADTRLYPASLTKIMTLYSAFDALKAGRISLDTQLPVSSRAEGMPPSKIGVRAGTTISVEDVILGLVTRSGNDAAVVIAEALGGTEYQFALNMTARARELGLRNTQFRNASGLPDSGQVSTARDMALLARRLMEDHPEYYHYFSTRNFTYRGTTHRNHNNLLRRYSGTDGIKTGYIRASGFNLVASVERDNRRVIAVVFGGRTAQTRDDHMITLLDRGFERLNQMQMIAIAPPPPKPESLFPTAVASNDTGQVSVTQTANLEEGSAASAIIEEEAGSGLGQATLTAALASTAANDNVVTSDAAPSALDAAAAAAAAGGGWSIQIGAFRSEAPARAMADNAAGRLTSYADSASVAVLRSNRDNLYRARLVGFTEADARNACRQLAGGGMDCLVVQPGDQFAVAAN